MDSYPLNLILATASGAFTIFLGFLQTRNISLAFFRREALKATIAWALIATMVPREIFHYHAVIAILCGGAWWKFRAERPLGGKIWLSIGSGLGISIGVMLILAVTPQANPAGQSPVMESLLLASIYLGGILIGLAYFCYVLVENISNNSGITQGLAHRFAKLLVVLVALHSVVVLSHLFSTLYLFLPRNLPYWQTFNLLALTTRIEMALLVTLNALLPFLAYYVFRATRGSTRVQPIRALIGLIFLGFIAEVPARLLGL